MSRLSADEQERAFVVLGLVLDRGDDGFVRADIEQALLDAELATAANVELRARIAVFHLRQEMGHDVVIWNRRLKLYRSSISRDEALHWLLGLVRNVEHRMSNMAKYLAAAIAKYPPTSANVGALDDLRESMRRVEYDADRAARQLVDSLT